MSTQARVEILGRLKSARKNTPALRSARPVLSEIGLDKEQLLNRFTAELNGQGGMVYQAKGNEDALRILSEIASAEGLKSVLATSENIYGVDIGAFGSRNSIYLSMVQAFSEALGLPGVGVCRGRGHCFRRFCRGRDRNHRGRHQ